MTLAGSKQRKRDELPRYGPQSKCISFFSNAWTGKFAHIFTQNLTEN